MVISTDGTPLFFLTRQSANILEDLARQITVPGSISLLHGSEGVGKSRLLNEFVFSRAQAQRITALKFFLDGTCGIVIGGKVQGKRSRFNVDALRKMVPGALLVVDDFQFAGRSNMQQLLSYWDLEAVSREQNLILTGDENLIAELRSLQQPVSRKINAVAIEPLHVEERVEYLSSLLCEQAWKQVVIGRDLKRKIRDSGGYFSALEELAKQYRGKVNCEDRSDKRAGKGYVFGVITLLMVAVAGGLYLNIESERPEQSDQAAMPGATDSREVTVGANRANDIAPATPNLETVRPDRQVRDNGDQQPIVRTAEAALAVVDEPEDKRDVQSVDIQQKPEADQSSSVVSAPPQDLLQQRLRYTDEWINNRPDQVSSIQIMTLSSGDDPKESLTDYLRRLETRGIDITQIYVYQVKKGGITRYGVLFGEFQNRGEAIKAINKLPRSLKTNGPIPRTIKGLKLEIERWRNPS